MTPCKGSYRVTSPYGWRQSPISGQKQHHNGIDMVGDVTLRAIWKFTRAEVVWGYNGGRGNLIRLYYSDSLRVIYQHLAAALVANGAAGRQGEVVATMGSSGDSTGAHLHAEVQRLSGGVWQAVEPSRYLEVPNAAGTYQGNDDMDDAAAEPKPSKEAAALELIGQAQAALEEAEKMLTEGEG